MSGDESIRRYIDGGNDIDHINLFTAFCNAEMKSPSESLCAVILPRVDSHTVVGWESDTDPENPVNFSAAYRWFLLSLASSITFITSISSSALAPAIPALLVEFHTNNATLGSFFITVYVLGLGIGPLFWGPLSELYGRVILQHLGDLGFIAFTVLCAVSTNSPMLVMARLIQGIFASVPMINGGGLIGDMVKQENRGFALSVYTMGILLGPSVGPVMGGFVAQAKGWRSVFWLLVLILTVQSIIALLLWRETYPPVLLARKAKKLEKLHGSRFRSQYDTGLGPRLHFLRSISRVFRMLAYSPIVLLLSIYMGFMYSYLYLVLTTLTPVFEDVYQWEASSSGLAFLGLGVGFLISQVVYGAISDRMLRTLSRKSGEMKPEYRLPPIVVGGVLIPASMFCYGWSAQARVQWMVPITGIALLAFGHNLIFMGIQSYIIDAFPLYAASGFSANAVIRSVMASAVPLFAPRMYARLGLGWGNSLLGFLALSMIFIPWCFLVYGERLRASNADRLKNL